MGAGTVDPEGAFRFGYIQYERDHSLRADSNGTLNDAGGTLTLIQVFTRENRWGWRDAHRQSTFLKVELPRRLRCGLDLRSRWRRRPARRSGTTWENRQVVCPNQIHGEHEPKPHTAEEPRV
jgi:hypothetical protein